MRELVISICDKVCCSADCHCKRYDDGDEFTCESCFIQEAIASAITPAVAEERERCAKVAEDMATRINSFSSHGAARNLQCSEVATAIRQTPTQEGV